jgi:beta-lactamase class D
MKTALRLVGFLMIFCSSLKAAESFILIDGNTNRVLQEFGPNLYRRVTPASTFKITLSLIGFDTGILADEMTPVWDFQEGYDDFLASWKSSQTPRSWMASSCVWFSKILTYELGLERFQEYLSSFEYGNQDLSSGLVEPGPLSPAWVSSSLKISPKEQVEFIQKIVLGALPISYHSFEMTKTILFKEKLPADWELYGKTGLGTDVLEDGKSERVRWFVGWIEKDKDFFPFAYQMRAKEVDVNEAIPRVKLLLKDSIVQGYL